MTKTFWKAAGIRAVRTICQTATAMIPTAVMLQQVSWLTVISTAACSGILSLLTSIGSGLPEVEAGKEGDGIELSNDTGEKH